MATVEVESAPRALEWLEREGPVPLLITDIYMPDMDGIELLRRVRKRWPDTAVLVITGVAEVGTAVECLQQGALDYLAKPVQLDEVRARIHNALERHRLSLENRYLQQSYHMSNNFTEVLFNKAKHDGLPEEIKAILKYVPHAVHSDMSWKSMHRMSQDFLDVQTKDKVKVYRTPKPILDAQLKAWDAVIAKRSAENPLFAKIVASQKAWAKRVMYWHNEVQVDQRSAYTHWFGKGPATT